MSDWSQISFGSGLKLDESTFDTKVGGGKFLDIGNHKGMTITEIEPKMSKAGNPYIRVRFENADGAGINHTVMLRGKPDENNNERLHWTYTQLSNAVAGLDLGLALKFFGDFLTKDPSKLESLVGMKVAIKVQYGKEGYIIKDVATGGKALIDVETGEMFPDTTVYPDFSAAKEAAEEHSLKRCYNEVGFVFASDKEDQEKNIEAINKIMKSGGAKKVSRPVSL